MKKLVINSQNDCKACLACEQACSEAFYKKYDPELSCIRIVEGKTPGTIKTKTCIQCGKCMRVCESEAITQNAKGVYMINKKKCTGCGKCVEACPMGVMVKAPEAETTSKCIACGICVKACPMDILEIKES